MAEKTLDLDDSILLCLEEGFDDLGTPTNKMDHLVSHKTPTFGNDGSSSMISLPCLSEETFSLMIKEEKNHLPRYDYLERLRSGDLDPSVRKQALDWMLKVQAHYGFGELAFCLAMNYLDRIFSSYELTCGLHMLALACLSIGAKMAEVEVPSVLDLQVEGPRFVSDAKSVRKMELVVMKNLKWRMNPCTPFSFTDYFIRKMMMMGKEEEYDDDKRPLISETMISKSVELITSTIKGDEFLEFKPSEIAAAVAIVVVAGETHADDVEKEISGFIHVEKDRVMKCFKLLKYTTLNEARVPHNSIGSMECIRINIDIGQFPSSPTSSPIAKRKKFDPSLEI